MMCEANSGNEIDTLRTYMDGPNQAFKTSRADSCTSGIVVCLEI